MKPLITSGATLLVLLSHVIQFTKATCFTTRGDIILQNHVIYSQTRSHIGECWQTCEVDPRCQSLNYFVQKLLCEINNRTIDLAPEDAVNVPFTAYFDNPYRGMNQCKICSGARGTWVHFHQYKNLHVLLNFAVIFQPLVKMREF